MSLLPSLKLNILMLTITALVSAAPLSRQHNNQQGTLKGTVVDLHDARVVTTKILPENKKVRQELTVDMNGEFEIKLPAGKYKFTAEAHGFYKYRQKAIQIETGKTNTLSIKFKVRPHDFRCPPGKICL